MSITIPPISEVGAKVGSTVAHGIAIGISLVRIHLRMRKDHVWWDDRLTVAAAAMDVVYMLTLWLKALDPRYELDGIVYYNAWILYFPCYFVIWTTRVSVWLSIARLYPPQHSTRRLAFLLMIIFSLLGILAIVAGVSGCRGSHWGLRFQYDHCFTFQTLRHLSQFEKFGAVIAALDVTCDAVLVIVPAYLLSRMRQIERKRKIVIIFLCCGSVLTLFGIMIVAIIIYGPFAETKDKFALVDCLSHLSTATSLLSANLLVVGTAFYIWLEGRIIDRRTRSAQRAPAPRRPTNSAANVTYNSGLTRISTSAPDFLSTITDGDLEDHPEEDLDEQETRPLFWSVPHLEGHQEDYELSVVWRATV